MRPSYSELEAIVTKLKMTQGWPQNSQTRALQTSPCHPHPRALLHGWGSTDLR